MVTPVFAQPEMGYRIPVSSEREYLHLHAAEATHYLGMEGLDSLNMRDISTEKAWSLISGTAVWERDFKPGLPAWVPLDKGLPDTVFSEIDRFIRKSQRKGDVYAYHGCWMGEAWKYYRLEDIDRILYYDYLIDPKTGKNLNPMPSWESTGLHGKLIETKASTQVDLVLGLYGARSLKKFLSNFSAQDTLINEVIRLLSSETHPGHGLHLDFGTRIFDLTSVRAFEAFALKLNVRLKNVLPDFHLSMTLPNRAPQGSYNFNSLNLYMDRFILMGYDYHELGHGFGPTSFFEGANQWGDHDIYRDIAYYHTSGLPYEKMLLSLPLFGVEWKSMERKFGAGPLEDSLNLRPLGYFLERQGVNIKYDLGSQTYYDIVAWKDTVEDGKSGQWLHQWWDTAYSLERKSSQARKAGLGGICLWALGYDQWQGAQPKVISDLLIATPRIIAPPKAAEDSVGTPMDSTKIEVQVEEEGDVGAIEKPSKYLIEGTAFSFATSITSKNYKVFYWIDVDTFPPLIPSTDEEFLFLSPDIPLPLGLIPPRNVTYRILQWSLLFIGCFIWLGLLPPLFRYHFRKLLFMDKVFLGFIYLPVVFCILLLLLEGFGQDFDWIAYAIAIVTGLLIVLTTILGMRDIKGPLKKNKD